jgi:hypothetical protein
LCRRFHPLSHSSHSCAWGFELPLLQFRSRSLSATHLRLLLSVVVPGFIRPRSASISLWISMHAPSLPRFQAKSASQANWFFDLVRIPVGKSRSCSWATGSKALVFLISRCALVVNFQSFTECVQWNVYEAVGLILVVMVLLVTLACMKLYFHCDSWSLIWFWGPIVFFIVMWSWSS